MKKQFLLLFIMLVFSRCTKPPEADNGHVSSIITSKIDHSVEWHQGCYEDRINCSVQALLEQELTPEAAVQIALLKNPNVQAIFEEVGIAHADLVEAGLFSNPAFEIEVRYPHAKRLKTNIEYLVTTAFLDFFLIPLRTKVAAAEFEQTKRRVVNEILNLAFEVRETYYALVAQQQALKYIQSIVELTAIQNEIASRQHDVSNINRLTFQQIQIQWMKTQLEMAKEQSLLIRLKEKLNRLLGLSEGVCLMLPELSQELDYVEFDLCALESVALEERLDLQEARFEVIRLCRMLGLKEGWTYTNLQAGVAGERDPDGLNVIGFGISGEIPIFNFGQAARMRLCAQLRQAQDRYAALEISILSEVREARQLLVNDLEMINDYRANILPLQNQITSSSEKLYNVMGLGVDRLLENKRLELETYQNSIYLLKEYWTTRVQLDKALGGYLYRLFSQDYCLEGAPE